MSGETRVASALRLVARGAGVRLVATGVTSVASLVTLALAVRLLGTSDYGRLAFLLTVVALLTGLSRVGWGPAAVRDVSLAAIRQDLARVRQTASAATGLATLASVIGIVAVIAIVPATAEDLPSSTRLLMVVGIALTVVGANAAATATSIARGLGRIALSEVPELAITLARLLIIVALAVAGARTLGPIAVMLAATGIAGVVVSRAVARACIPQPGRRPDATALRTLLRASTPFLLQGLAAMAVARFDVLILGLTAAKADVGQYEGTLRVTERLLQFLPFLLLPQYLPAAAQLWGQGHEEGFRRVYRTVSGITYWLTFPVALVLASFPEPLLRLLYGADFPVAPGLVWLLLLGFFPYAALCTSWSTLASTGATRVLLRVSGLTLAVMLVSGFTLIPAFGPPGAAAATAVSLLTQQVGAAVMLYRRHRVHAFDATLLRMAALSGAFIGIAAVLRGMLLEANTAAVVAGGAMLAATWLVLAWRFSGVRAGPLVDVVRRARVADPAPAALG